tara:strand:+ start:97363 stop:97728 length:366 start_codon:yes stop_codon:yes gene_type:complete
MPQFVLLEHDHPELHWDLMLERGDALLTWRLDRIPAAAGAFAATSLPDHRVAYLDYEGPVSGNRGSVLRIDRGDFELLAAADENIFVRLKGARLQGTAEMQRVSSGDAPDQPVWQLIWLPD